MKWFEALHILKYRSEPFQNNDSDGQLARSCYADVLLMLGRSHRGIPRSLWLHQPGASARRSARYSMQIPPVPFADKLLCRSGGVELAF